MSCSNLGCRLNDELLALLPNVSLEEQQRVLGRWPGLDLHEREAIVRGLREPAADKTDLQTLSRLASYFQCGVYDVMRYTGNDQ